MIDDYYNDDVISNLIDEELSSKDKISKPDFTQRAGREFLAFYLQSKFEQLFNYDKKALNPLIIDINKNFINNFSSRLISNPSKRIMIGITGESASGKSTICKAISSIIESFDMPITVLTTDNYFKDISSLIKKYGSFDKLRDSGYDIDSPNNFQLEVLRNDLRKLSIGENIKAPEYLLNGTGVSIPNSRPIESNKIIVVEGIASMYEGINDVFDVKVYVETSYETRKQRFVKRAYTERNQNLEEALSHWEYILGAGEKYVKPARNIADLILNGETDIDYFFQILEYIHAITNNFDEN